MKILLLTKKFPYPAKDGETIAIMQLIRGLAAEGHELTALCINTKKHFSDINQLPNHIMQLATFYAVTVNTDPHPAKALLNLFSSESYHYVRFYSKIFERNLIEILQKKHFDIIQLEGLYLLLYLNTIRKHTKAKVVLRAHNIEFEIWERTIAQMSCGWKRAYLHLQTRRLKRFEISHAQKVDAIVAISDSDKNKFNIIAPALPKIALPVGIDIAEKKPDTEPEPLSVAYLGGMDWLPNQEGVKWFLTHCWSLILQQIPNARFYLAGRNMPAAFYNLPYPNFTVDGEVSDARKYVLSKKVVIVPLLSGSGIRVKIIENMSWGKAIVSTTIGAEGIAAHHGQHLLLADTPADFAHAVCRLLRDDQLCRQIGENAFNFAKQHFDNKILSRQLVAFYEKIAC